MNLTVVQRERLLALLPKYEQKATGRKRADPVKVFEGIVFVLETGCAWDRIDKAKYASYQTCHRYFQEWVADGTLEKALRVLVDGCEKIGKLDLSDTFIDGSFVRSKKGAIASAAVSKAMEAD